MSYKNSSRDDKKYRKDDCSSSSDDDCDDKEELYCYFKHKLLCDNQMMVKGSDAYWNAWSKEPGIILKNEHAKLREDTIAFNIEHPNFNAPGFVREDGVYVIFFISETTEASQYTLFINGTPDVRTTTSNNAGAGQLIMRWIIALKKDDAVTVRNYQSSVGALTLNTSVGGLLETLNLGLTLLKIAPLEEYCFDNEEKYELDRKKKHLFRKMEEKLLCDNALQMKGFDVHGVFFTKELQSVPVEAPVVFNRMINVHGLCPIKNNNLITAGETGPNCPPFSQVRIEEDGIYKVFFLCTTDTAAQFAIFVNNVAVPYTVNGTNKGAGQLTIRVILKLKKGDIITANNHTSGNGAVALSQNSGGRLLGISAILVMFKLANWACADLPKYNRKWEDKYDKCLYKQFKQYLLENKYTQPAGSDAFISVSSSTPQTLKTDDALIWNYELISRNIKFTPGKTEVCIRRTGDYDIFADIISDRPAQYTVFVNGCPVLDTTSGRDSGGNRALLRQIIHLCKGDVVTVRNHISLLGDVTTTQNSSGELINSAASLMLFKLSNPKRHRKHC